MPFVKILRPAVSTLFFCFLLSFAFESEARAYTDPGSGTLILQMLAAGFVGAMFYFRKFTARFFGQKPFDKKPPESQGKQD